MTRPTFRPHAGDLLASVLVLAGLTVLGHTLWSWSQTAEADFATSRAPAAAVPAFGVAMDQPVDIDALLSKPAVAPLVDEARPGPPAPVLALFLLHAKVCPPCLAELAEYVELLEMANLGGADASVRAAALVIEEDPALGERFVLTTPLPLAVGHGPSAVLGGLADHLGDRQRFQQVVFLDLERGVLFYRVRLPNTLTPRDLKQSVLREMRAAHRRVAA